MEEELPSSCLGTKEYWDEIYNTDYANYEDHGDEGEIWFGESTVKRIINWLSKSSCIQELKAEKCSVLDLGCGNGLFAMKLKDFGFKSVTGIDYSENAVKLAKKIVTGKASDVNIQKADILDMKTSTVFENKYDICTDKGTYDAISLDPSDSKSKRELYVHNVTSILQPQHGLLIITSCNWTENELVTHFNQDFQLLDRIPMPSFQFGGQSGQKVTSLVLQKKCK